MAWYDSILDLNPFEDTTEPTFTTMDMMRPDEKLSMSFSVKDFSTTSTGLFNLPPRSMQYKLKQLAALMEEVYTKIGPFNIASAYRSDEVNEAVGGSPTSRHLFGDAIDISPTTMTAEKYWGAILLDDVLRNKMGHIAWKSHQNNAIHITLPFTRSDGTYIHNVPQVAKKIAGSVGYYSASTDVIQTAKNKYLGVTPSTEVVVAGVSVNWAAIGVGIAGLTALGMIFLRRRK